MGYQHNYDDLLNAITSICGEQSVFEIRCLTSTKRVDAGYFDNPATAADSLLSVGGYYTGIYITPNPLNSSLLARSYNRISQWAPHTTSDNDVLSRRWLLIDLDPIRPSGISSTDAEHRASIAKAQEVGAMLALIYGWPPPMMNSSGNGSHLMYPLEEANDEIARDEIAKCLKCISAKWSNTVVKIDTMNFNAARIWRLPYTWAHKGDNIPDRPHRQARILQHILHDRKVSLFDIIRFNKLNEHLLQPIALATGVKNRTEYPENEKLYKALNDHAMRRVTDWVPVLFPDARPYRDGYRISSSDLGLDFEEDLTIHPWPLGIKYFGVADLGDATEGRRTPVAVIAEFCFNGDKVQAARKLAEVLKAPITEFDLVPLPATPPATTGMADLLGSKPIFKFKGIRTVADLQKQAFQEQTWVVKGVLPTGNIMLASRPKMRKTWLALQLGMAIASGRPWLGWEVNQGDVLALLLEDNERRLQHRIRTLQQFDMMPPDLSGFKYWTGGVSYTTNGRLTVTDPEEQAELLSHFPRGEAGVDALEQYLEQYPNTSTIIIDTYAHFRDNTGNSKDVYQRDYDAMMPITRLASRKNVLIIPVHHEKKGLANSTSGDFLEDVNGSSGVTGGVDGVMSIKGRRGVQDENESRKLFISGRDIPHDYEIDISFDAASGGWRTAQKQDIRLLIIDLLQRHPYINQVEMGNLLPNISKSRMSKTLTDMKFAGEIIQGRFGYSLKRD